MNTKSSYIILFLSFAALGGGSGSLEGLKTKYLLGGAKRTASDELATALREIRELARSGDTEESRLVDEEYESALRQVAAASHLRTGCPSDGDVALNFSWAMTNEAGQFCAGKLVGDGLVLTSASCLAGLYPRDVLLSPKPSILIPATKFYLHVAGESKDSPLHDVALVSFNSADAPLQVENLSPLRPCSWMGAMGFVNDDLVVASDTGPIAVNDGVLQWLGSFNLTLPNNRTAPKPTERTP